VRNYKNAHAHFQQLQVERELVRNTILCILQTEPTEGENLDRIRAIAIHCYQPLQVFISKMRFKESSLGHFRTAGTLGAVGAWLHWSMVAEQDVDDLRKVILSEMVAINMLLSVQQL